LRGQDSNLRPSGYEPDELPGCSTPRPGPARWRSRGPRKSAAPPACGSRGRPCVSCVRRRASLPFLASPGPCRAGFRGVRRTRRRPALPRLGTQYHGRGGVSRPSSGRDRVGHPRCGRRVGRASRTAPRGRVGREGAWAGWLGMGRRLRPSGGGAAAGAGELSRAIRTGRLRASPRLHPRPIDVVVCHGPDGEARSPGGFPA
jgi:hypothetical protein